VELECRANLSVLHGKEIWVAGMLAAVVEWIAGIGLSSACISLHTWALWQLLLWVSVGRASKVWSFCNAQSQALM